MKIKIDRQHIEKAIRILKSVGADGTFKFMDGNMTVSAVDPAKVYMTSATFPVEIEPAGNVCEIGLRTDALSGVLSFKGDVIDMEVDNAGVTMKVGNGTRKTAQLTETSKIKRPPLTFKSNTAPELIDLKSVIRAVSDVSDTVIMKMVAKSFIVTSKDNKSDNVTGTIGEGEGADSKMMVDGRFLAAAINSIPPKSNIKLQFSTDFPLSCEWVCDGGDTPVEGRTSQDVRGWFLLAPKIETE